MKKAGFYILLLSCLNVKAQEYFEGEIIYKTIIQKKDPAFDVTSIPIYPATTLSFLFKQGLWINRPDTSMIEFGHFRWDDNRQYYKFRGFDTLYYTDYSVLNPELEGLQSIDSEMNTDTILGMICNSLILKTPKLTLTLVYSPLIAVNPTWFEKTKGAYYDLIYSRTKSLYLKSIVEYEQYISSDEAVKITNKKIPNEVFESINKLPKVPL